MGRKPSFLIDEYDVPLDKAFQNGYYKEMTTFDPRNVWRGTLRQMILCNLQY